MNQQHTVAPDGADTEYAMAYFTGPAVPAAERVAEEVRPAVMARSRNATGRPGQEAARALGVLQLTLAAIFVIAGAATLVGTPDVLTQFGAIDNATGLGTWFRLGTGILELLGGVLLCVRATVGVGAVLLGAVMIGAILVHVFVLRTAPTAAAALGVALAVTAYARRATLAVVAAHLERNL